MLPIVMVGVWDAPIAVPKFNIRILLVLEITVVSSFPLSYVAPDMSKSLSNVVLRNPPAGTAFCVVKLIAQFPVAPALREAGVTDGLVRTPVVTPGTGVTAGYCDSLPYLSFAHIMK